MSRSEKKEQTRQRMVSKAAEGFRHNGYGIGVDALAKSAGVTSGAFYVHFGSKSEAFRLALDHGLADLLMGVRHFQNEHRAAWWQAFVLFYLGAKRTCTLADSCSLQTLTPEVARADGATQQLFETRLREVAAQIVQGPASPGQPRTVDEACAALALLIGAVTLARAVPDGGFADQLARSAAAQLLPQGADGR